MSFVHNNSVNPFLLVQFKQLPIILNVMSNEPKHYTIIFFDTAFFQLFYKPDMTRLKAKVAFKKILGTPLDVQVSYPGPWMY